MKLTTEEVLEKYDDGNMKVVGYYKKVSDNKHDCEDVTCEARHMLKKDATC